MGSQGLTLYCGCVNSEAVPKAVRQSILSALVKSGSSFIAVPDLCGAAASRDASLTAISGRDNVRVIACHPRAVRSLLKWAGITPGRDWTFFNMREQTAEEVIAALDLAKSGAPSGKAPDLPQSKDWPPWFPIIDGDRCRQCKQCLSFCLFGVYENGADKKVRVANPRNCKNNCPACARICPEAAIIFPKLDEEPINGSEIGDEQAVRAKIKLNVSAMLGDDPYSALAERRKKVRSRLIREQAIEQARKERDTFRKTGANADTGGRS